MDRVVRDHFIWKNLQSDQENNPMETGMMIHHSEKKQTNRTKFRVPYLLLGMITGTVVGIGLILFVAEFVI